MKQCRKQWSLIVIIISLLLLFMCGSGVMGESQHNETAILSPNSFIEVVFNNKSSMSKQDLQLLLTSLQGGEKTVDDDDNCLLTVDQLLEIHGISGAASQHISAEQFRSICPGLIHQHQSYSRSKIRSSSNDGDDRQQHYHDRDNNCYGYGTAAVFIISYLPAAVLFSLPDAKKPNFPYFMHTARGLATSAMVSYVMLLLLPNAFGIQEESNGDDGEKASGAKFSQTLFKSVTFLCTLYVMYLLEMIIGTRSKVEKEKANETISEVRITTPNDSLSPPLSAPEGIIVINTTPSTTLTISKHVKDFLLDCIPPKAFGWMLVLGDSIDNFMDGLTIGAMFSISLTDGICTSIAILVHEIPNEIGDFGALLSTGMPWRGCMTWNLMESCAAFIGLYVGLRFSTDEPSQQFMCALTAGIFLYVSLTGILPELHDIKEQFWFSFFLQNIGIQFGFWSMFLITVFEEAMSHMLD